MTEGENTVHIVSDQQVVGVKVFNISLCKFELGGKYYDAIGRRWKITKIRSLGSTVVFIVRHRFRREIAVLDTPTRAIVLFDEGFTTIYVEGDE